MTPRLVTLYQIIGSRHGDHTAFPTRAAAEHFATQNPTFYPDGWRVQEIEYTLPSDAIWQNEAVIVDLHIGGEALGGDIKVATGGRWYKGIPGYAHVNVVNLSRGEVHGAIHNQYGQHLQTVLLRDGHGGFPYRHLRRRSTIDQIDDTLTIS